MRKLNVKSTYKLNDGEDTYIVTLSRIKKFIIRHHPMWRKIKI